MTVSRTAALSDGIIAIAATLLVLEIRHPDPSSDHLWRALWHEWPAYLAYVISFLTIGILLVNHHVLYDAMTSIDRSILFLNLVLMMLIAFIPFPTGFLAEAFRERDGESVATILYGATMFSIALVFTLTWRYLKSHRSLLIDPDSVDRRLRRSFFGPVAYAAATAIAIVAPLLAVGLFAALALYFVLPGRHALAGNPVEP